MEQLEIQFYWPLTEQVNLNLDYTPCEEYEKEKRRKQRENSISYGVGVGSVLMNTGTTVAWTSVNTSKIQTNSFVFKPEVNNAGKWEITDNMFVYRPSKPNAVIRFFAKKLLGFKWHDE